MRKFIALFSLEAIKHFIYVPIIVYEIKNWFQFLLNYIGFKDFPNTILFRNGIKIRTNENVDFATIAVIFIKRDYGNVEDNSIVIDIGANIGAYSVFAATITKNTTVYAYEPMRKSFELFLENIKLNDLAKNIEPFNLGISSKKEKRRLYLSDSSVFHSIYSKNKNKKSIEISCISLKDVFEENKIKICDILKMDCEGAEFEIFYNTPDSCFKKVRKINLEYHNQPENKKYNVKCLLKFLERKGFKLRRIREDPDGNSGVVWLEHK